MVPLSARHSTDLCPSRCHRWDETRQAVDAASDLSAKHIFQTTEPFIGEGRPLFSAVCKLDLEGIVAKRMADPYGPRTKWWKIPNPGYSQKIGRAELFERRRAG